MFESFDKTSAIERVEINELLLAKTGKLETPAVRPWELSVNNVGLGKLQDLEESSGAISRGLLSGGNLTSISSDILAIGNPTQNATIANGWDTTRMVFTIKVSMYYNTGGQPDIYILQGYTDYFETSMNNQIDPDIRFYINSIHKENSAVVNSVIATDKSNLDIFNPSSVSNNGSLLRPSDIFTGIQVENVIEGGVLGSASTITVGSAITSTPKLSSNENLSPGRYIAKLLNSFIKAEPYAYDSSSSSGNSLEQAISMAREDVYSSNPFLSVLSDVVRSGDTSSIFKLRDIHKLDPSIENRIKFSPDEPIKYESDNINSLSLESNVANSIATILFSVMSSLEIQGLKFIAHNRLVQNSSVLTSTSVIADQFGNALEIHRLDGSNQLRDADKLESTAHIMISAELLNYVSRNGMFDYYMTVDAVIGFNILVTISINGGADTPFTIPWAMNSMFIPIVGAQSNIKDLSYGTSDLLEKITH